MNIEFLSTVAVITPDPPVSRKLYLETIGPPHGGTSISTASRLPVANPSGSGRCHRPLKRASGPRIGQPTGRPRRSVSSSTLPTPRQSAQRHAIPNPKPSSPGACSSSVLLLVFVGMSVSIVHAYTVGRTLPEPAPASWTVVCRRGPPAARLALTLSGSPVASGRLVSGGLSQLREGRR
jgi:hypothetical protein